MNLLTKQKRIQDSFSLVSATVIILICWVTSEYALADETKPEHKHNVQEVRLLRYFSPKGLLQQDTRDIAQLETGEILKILPKPMGILTGLLMPALPIPGTYRASVRDIEDSELPDGRPKPVNVIGAPVILRIDRNTGEVCYLARCAKLTAICAPGILMSRPNGPGCQFYKN